MDPAFLEARARHKHRKPEPSKEPTDFQRQLAKNPFALAIASPMRKCVLTNVKLPAYFLQDFIVMTDPKARQPWYVPASLSDKHLPTQKKAVGDQEDDPELGIEKSQRQRIGFKVYTLNSKLAIDAMQDVSEYKRSHTDQQQHGQSNLIPLKMRSFQGAMKAYSHSKWRPDMGDFVLELMKRRILSSLKHLWALKRGYLVGCTDWDDALAKPQAAALLWLGKLGDESIAGPPEFATLDIGTSASNEVQSGLGKKKRKVPVFNLEALLGKEKLADLRALAPDCELLVLKHKNATVETQSKLWKLQGYLAQHPWAIREMTPAEPLARPRRMNSKVRLLHVA